MEKITTVIDGKSSKEFVKGTYILDYVTLGVAAFCVLLYFIFAIRDRNWFSGLNLIMLIVSIALIIIAIILLNMLNKAIKKADEFKRTITYEFGEEHLSYEVMRNEEIIESGKLPYTDLTCYRVTYSYVFVGLKNNTWFAIDKSNSLIDFLSSKGLKKK